MFLVQLILLFLLIISCVFASAQIRSNNLDGDSAAWDNFLGIINKSRQDQTEGQNQEMENSIPEIDEIPSDLEIRGLQSTRATNHYKKRLLNKEGLFLAVSKSGKVYGVHKKSRSTAFRILVYNKSKVRLQNIETRKYVAVSCHNRKIFATAHITNASFFKYIMGKDHWERFQPLGCAPSQTNMASNYLGFKKDGKNRKATLTTFYNASAMFLFEPI